MQKKLDTVISELDGIHDKLNNIYAEGAIEGYSDKWLGFFQKLFVGICSKDLV